MDNVKYFGRLGGTSCELERFDSGEVSIELEGSNGNSLGFFLTPQEVEDTIQFLKQTQDEVYNVRKN